MDSLEGRGGAALGMAAPIGAGERILALDVLRGVAVLGILLMNITAAGLVWPAYINPTVMGGSTGADLWAWITTEMLFEGTMRTLFSMLFGAGVIVFTTRAEKKDPTTSADLYYRRTILLIFFGVVHGYLLLWPGDVLYTYGMTGLFLFPLRRLSGQRLLTLGLIVLVVFSVAMSVSDERGFASLKAKGLEAMAAREGGAQLTEEQEEAIEEWESRLEDFQPSADAIKRRMELRDMGYGAALRELAPIIMYTQTTDFYLYMFWDSLGMMLIGMGLVKMRVVTGERSAGTYAAMMAAGYTVGLLVNAYETRHVMQSDFAPSAFIEAGRTYHLGRLAVAMGHMGLVLLVVRAGAIRWLTRPLSAVGRMALTNYLSQTVICNLLFFGFGFGLFGELSRAQLYIVVGAVWLAQMIWSPMWLAWFRFGPVEWLWRWLTYGRMPAMRRLWV